MANFGSQLGPGWFLLIRYRAVMPDMCVRFTLEPSLDMGIDLNPSIRQCVDLEPSLQLELEMGCCK